MARAGTWYRRESVFRLLRQMMYRPLGNISGVKDMTRVLDEERNSMAEHLTGCFIDAACQPRWKIDSRSKSIRFLNEHTDGTRFYVTPLPLRILGGPQILLVEPDRFTVQAVQAWRASTFSRWTTTRNSSVTGVMGKRSRDYLERRRDTNCLTKTGLT